MRDANRIPRILNKLGSYWREHPDLRLAQVVVNASRASTGPSGVFYVEDDVIERFLDLHEGPQPERWQHADGGLYRVLGYPQMKVPEVPCEPGAWLPAVYYEPAILKAAMTSDERGPFVRTRRSWDSRFAKL